MVTEEEREDKGEKYSILYFTFELAIFSDIYLRVKTNSVIYEGMLYFLQFRN